MSSSNGIDTIEIIKDHVALLDERHSKDIKEIKELLKEHVSKSRADKEELLSMIKEVKDQILIAKTIVRTVKVLGYFITCIILFRFTEAKTIILQLFK